MTIEKARLTIFIASPLEPEHVDRIRSVAPDDAQVIYEPDLLPTARYNADHKGKVDFSRTREQEARWQKLLKRADVLWDFPPVAPGGKSIYDLVPNLKWVQTTSSGVGQLIRLLGVHNSDLLVTTARGVHAGPLSEFVFLALLSHMRQLPHLQAEQRRHHWERFCGDELAGKTLAIIGAGEVGRRVAAVGACFGMRVVALGRTGSDRTAEQLGVDVLFPRERLHDMLAQADALVLSVPHTAGTEGMIDEAALAALKPGGVLVNIARGQVIDQEAMIEALRSGKIGFAALDVFAVEPLPSDSPLWDLPNVLISPHSSSTAESENGKITDIFCHNLRCYLQGRRGDMQNILDKARMY